MGRTIRTIIVLLAAVLLLAGCDPKMGNQGGFGAQGGEETQGGVTINGITFPPKEDNIQFEENPSAATIELLEYLNCAMIPLGNFLEDFFTYGPSDYDTAEERDWASKMEVINHQLNPKVCHYYLKDGESCKVPVQPDGYPASEIIVTEIEYLSVDNGEYDRTYRVGSFSKDGQTHTFLEDYDYNDYENSQIKLDGVSYHPVVDSD